MYSCADEDVGGGGTNRIAIGEAGDVGSLRAAVEAQKSRDAAKRGEGIESVRPVEVREQVAEERSPVATKRVSIGGATPVGRAIRKAFGSG